MNRKILDAFERAGGNVRLIDGAIWTYTDNGFDPKKIAEQSTHMYKTIFTN